MTTDEALLNLLAYLKTRDYNFIAVTPETHARVLRRPLKAPPTLRDIFGWNREFSVDDVDPQLLDLLRHSNSLDDVKGRFRSRIRVASLNDHLFIHSSFPTTNSDAVFFGPDTYRFARFLGAQLTGRPEPRWIVDMGAGSGAGGVAATDHAHPERLSFIDINPAAARLAELNSRFAGVRAEVRISGQIPAGCDLVIANPPYMIDPAGRTYRDGGQLFGGAVAYEWTVQALHALEPRGTLLLYTGAAIVEGKSPLLAALRSLASETGAELHVENIDEDVFGEELERPSYSQVERIAAFGIRIAKTGALP